MPFVHVNIAGGGRVLSTVPKAVATGGSQLTREQRDRATKQRETALRMQAERQRGNTPSTDMLFRPNGDEHRPQAQDGKRALTQARILHTILEGSHTARDIALSTVSDPTEVEALLVALEKNGMVHRKDNGKCFVTFMAAQGS